MLTLSKILLVLTAIAAVLSVKTKEKHRIKTIYVVICGVFLSVWAATAYVDGNSINHMDKTDVFLSVLHSVQVMLAGFEFENLYETLQTGGGTYIYLAFLFALAPICTFGFVLSFFERFTSCLKYVIKRRKDIYILSEINEKSVALARSVREKDKGALIVFMKNERGDHYDDAKSTGAVFFEKNIKRTTLMLRAKKAGTFFFVMGENESENLEVTLTLTEKFKDRQNTEIYVLSTSQVGGLVIDSADKGVLKVRRINESRQLALSEISNTAPEKSLLQNAAEEKISVLIVGMGGYGTEFLKAALWCGQLPGRTLEINVIDKNEQAKSIFCEMCPEIVSKNGNESVGEACYNLNFYEGIDVKAYEFEKIIADLKETTLAFVALGNDELNIETAIMLRTLLARGGCRPAIKSVVYSSEKHRMLGCSNLINYKNQSYDISFIGSVDECFSLDGVTNSVLEGRAAEHHLSYVQNRTEEEKKSALESFNRYEYFRNSSAATAVYRTYFNKAESYSAEEKEKMGVYEHMRWNAYMRCEGYVFGEVRDDLAKTHPDLVHYSKLSKEDIDKDMRMVETV